MIQRNFGTGPLTRKDRVNKWLYDKGWEKIPWIFEILRAVFNLELSYELHEDWVETWRWEKWDKRK